MAEPTSTSTISIAALAVALFGPMAGPYALILFAALAGALWPLSTSASETRGAGAWMLLRCTTMAVLLTGGVSTYAQSHYGVPAHEALAPVAFVIGALGNGWRTVIETVREAIRTVIARAGGVSAAQPTPRMPTKDDEQ